MTTAFPGTPVCVARAWPILLYLVLAIVLTWPLARHFTTHVTGDGIDDPSLALEPLVGKNAPGQPTGA